MAGVGIPEYLKREMASITLEFADLHNRKRMFRKHGMPISSGHDHVASKAIGLHSNVALFIFDL